MPSFRDFGIDESVIDIFNSLNPPLKTIDGLLQRDLNELAKQTKISLIELTNMKSIILQKYSTKPSPFSFLLKRSYSFGAIFQTQFKQLDDLLGGGFYTGYITELCGSSSSNKTKLCQYLISQITYRNGTVLYIDPCHSYAQRILPPTPLLILFPVYSIDDLYNGLLNIDLSNPILIIIENINLILNSVIGTPEGNLKLYRFIILLRMISSENNKAVIITNGSDEEGKHSLGSIWSHCPNRRYLMQIQDENTIITCIKGPKTVYIISRVGGEMLH